MAMGSGQQWHCAVSFRVIFVCVMRCCWAAGVPGWVLGEYHFIKVCHSWRREAAGPSLVGLLIVLWIVVVEELWVDVQLGAM